MWYLLIIIPIAFLFTACSSEEQSTQKPIFQTEDVIDATDNEILPTVNYQVEIATKETFQNDPVKVVEAVFDAAKTKDYSVLSTLCDPMGDNDDPTSNMCNVANATQEREKEFVEYFSQGQVVGEGKIEGNTASVPIKFGPKGDLDEVFVLVLRNGLWYLGQI
jgi:hypothetical protein|tara:strand:+ start:4169 stop:4657 length:489 start_codon:yes stop_codon:yes gene_type:complete